MPKLLYISEFVDRCAPPTEDQRSTWIRRCQLWTDAGILPIPTVEPKGGGRRRRVYRESTVPLAAVLLRVSDIGVEASLLEWISTTLQKDSNGRGRFGRFWRAALKGNRSTAYISFSREAGRPHYHFDEKQFGLASWASILTDEPKILLDLAAVFAEVRYAAEA